MLLWKKKRLLAVLVFLVSASLIWYLWIYEPDEVIEKTSEQKRNLPRDWSKNMFDDLVEECKKGVEDIDDKYADLVQAYCECSAEMVMDEMTYDDYRTYARMPQQAQDSIFRPLSEPCQHMVNQMMLDKLREEGANGRP